MMLRDCTPASRLASGLIPTDSISMPRAVLRTRTATATNTTTVMITEAGRPNQKPEPMTLNGGELIVVILPSVISMAIPRPAVIRTSVAMIG